MLWSVPLPLLISVFPHAPPTHTAARLCYWCVRSCSEINSRECQIVRIPITALIVSSLMFPPVSSVHVCMIPPRNDVADHLSVFQCSVEAYPALLGRRQVDLIVSNPPYITTDEMAKLWPEILWWVQSRHAPVMWCVQLYLRQQTRRVTVCIRVIVFMTHN